MTYREDSQIKFLQAVARRGKDALPAVGRAVLEEIFFRGRSRGEWGRGAGMLNEWQALGSKTKKMLFRDPGLIHDIDQFLLLAERSMRTANPSHTGHIATALSEFKTVVRMAEGGGLIFHPEAVAAAEAAGWLGSKLFTRGPACACSPKDCHNPSEMSSGQPH